MSQNLIAVLRENKLDVPERVMREPNKNDDNRWVEHTISGKSYLFTQPLTFTPYASVFLKVDKPRKCKVYRQKS